MKYQHTGGMWREYRGYVFLGKNPVEITDRATLELIKSEPNFKEVKDEAQETATASEILIEPAKGKECQVCHKLIPRGWYMHQKWCKG